MGEDKVLKSVNIISSLGDNIKNNLSGKLDEFLERKATEQFDKSRRYAIPNGYWTLEVFYKGHPLIPEERVVCLAEPNLDEHAQMVDLLGGTNGRYMWGKDPTWRPVTVTYSAYGDNVGSMLIEQYEELEMVRNATAELTYWLGVDTPDRTWTLKDWTVTDMQTTPSNNAIIGFDLTFRYSEASLTRY